MFTHRLQLDIVLLLNTIVMTSFNRPSGGSRILKGMTDYMVWEASSGVQDQRSVGIKPPGKYVWRKVPQQLSSFASLSLISDVASTVMA